MFLGEMQLITGKRLLYKGFLYAPFFDKSSEVLIELISVVPCTKQGQSTISAPKGSQSVVIEQATVISRKERQRASCTTNVWLNGDITGVLTGQEGRVYPVLRTGECCFHAADSAEPRARALWRECCSLPLSNIKT